MRSRWASAAVCLLLTACGSGSTADEGPPPERSVREGQDVQLDGAGGIAALWESGEDPAVLVAQVYDRRSGLPPECRRYTEVRVLAQDDERVELAAYQYRPAWEVEPECPQVPADPATHTVRLRGPLGDRDVVDSPQGQALHVQGRRVPGRSPYRGSPSCAEVSATAPAPAADYRHFVRHGGRTYESHGDAAPAVLVGPPLGTVTCVLSGSLTPTHGYVWQDGHAGFLPTGTPYFAVEGRPVEQAVGAVWDGRPTLFALSPD